MGRDRRGEVWLVDLGYAAKTRPALVISVPALDTDRALVALCRIQPVRVARVLRSHQACDF
jgi:mRNA-degrading endonuclease toxin of MazEF toxin-antitoxin module